MFYFCHLIFFEKEILKNNNYYCNNMFLKKSKLMKMEKKDLEKIWIVNEKKAKISKTHLKKKK